MRIEDSPIFIMGMMPRSGTVWLRQLLLLHPHCAGAPPWEDWLVPNAHRLQHYIEAVYKSWQPAEAVREDWLYEALGRGLLTVWTGRIGEKRLVTKTPSVENIGLFSRFFPQAYLLILVRDGRAVAESNARSFDLDYETGMRRWAKAAREILWLRHTMDTASSRALIVRYEDLYTNLDQELRRILQFVRLPVEAYNFEAAKTLPVRGSSMLKNSDSERVHWDPVDKTSDFQPMLRWRHWKRFLHERFNWIAAGPLEAFGYEPVRFGGPRLFWNVANLVLDLRWWLLLVPRAMARRFAKHLRFLMFPRAISHPPIDVHDKDRRVSL